ncbi:hypothetical protein CK203_079913 [Vitis vinifera]|uniref:Uncharacterized protein n=1 Tax=Vitis vinifera TaxID=29760 RepID=A0A438E4V1_VITVI|nr:hypothetical protein CK203_079913 [Vitis vinifera]
MAKKVATRRELLVRWRGIEEVIGDDVLRDTPKTAPSPAPERGLVNATLLPHGVSIVFVFTLLIGSSFGGFLPFQFGVLLVTWKMEGMTQKDTILVFVFYVVSGLVQWSLFCIGL